MTCIENVRYVPDLSESIYSLFCHIKSPSHSIYSSFEDGLFIEFPTFKVQAILGDSDIYLDIVPISVGQQSTMHDTTSSFTTDSFCRNLKQFTEDVTAETKYLDNLLVSIRNYYKEVKTRCQLNLEMPAGFRRNNLWCRQLRDYKQAQHSSPIDSLDNDFITSLSDSSSQIPIQDNELDDLPVSPVLIGAC